MSLGELLLATAALLAAELYWYERKRRLRAELALLAAELYWYERKRRLRAELKALPPLPYEDAEKLGISAETLDSWDDQMRGK